MKSLLAQFSFFQLRMLCTASASVKNMWSNHISCFDHFVLDMAFSSINTSEKQAKYEQQEWKHSFQPSWQLKGPWISFLPRSLHPLTAATTDMMYWETGNVKIIKKQTFHSHAVVLESLGFHGTMSLLWFRNNSSDRKTVCHGHLQPCWIYF